MKLLSFKDHISLNIFFIYLFFNIILFLTFNSSFLDNIRQKFIDENNYAANVAKDMIEQEKEQLIEEARIIANDELIYRAFKNGIYFDSDWQIDGNFARIEVSKTNKMRYIQLANYAKVKLYGKASRTKRRSVALYDSTPAVAANSPEFIKTFLDKGPESYIRDALGTGGLPGIELSLIDMNEDSFYIKGMAPIGKDVRYKKDSFSNIGIAVIGESLDGQLLDEIKRIINRDVLIFKENEMITSTIFKDTIRAENSTIHKSSFKDSKNRKNSFTAIINNKKYGVTSFPIFGYSKEPLAYIGIAFEYTAMEQIYKSNNFRFTISEILFSILLLAVTFFLFKLMFKPLNDILDGIKRIGAGNYSARINISTRKELQLIADSINNLSKTIASRENELEEKNRQLIDLDRLKDDFLANTSHELRTPLNGVIGLSESLIDGVSGPLPDKAVYNLRLISQSGKRLLNLVNDILDFSKIKKQELLLHKTFINLKTTSDRVLLLCQHLAKTKNIELINTIPDSFPSIFADENRLQQILYNLVGNAIKFTESGTVILSAEAPDGFAVISVKDTGIGIPSDKYDAVFEHFSQLDSSTTRKHGGTGLGLSITKQLVELHGGTITLLSEPEKGSEFVFTIPFYKQENQLPRPTEPAMPLSQANKALIVDSNPLTIQAITDLLLLHNFETDVVLPGDSFPDKPCKENYSLIIVGENITNPSPYELIKNFKPTAKEADCFAVLLLERFTEKNILKAKQAGFSKCYEPPKDKAGYNALIDALVKDLDCK